MKKNNPLLFFDFETGGLNKKNTENSSDQYPVTEIAFIGINSSDYSTIFEYDNLIKPYDDSLVYSTEAAEKTGITKKICEEKGETLTQILKDVNLIFTETVKQYGDKFGNKPILVGHNVQFDIDFLQKILYTNKKQSLLQLLSAAPDSFNNLYPDHFDTRTLAKQFWRNDPSKGSFKLIDCCKYAGIPIEGTHRALVDVRLTVDLFKYMMTNFKSGVDLIENKSNDKSTQKRYQFQY